MKLLLSVSAIICSLLCVVGSHVNGAVENASRSVKQLQPTTRPSMIYVSDFAIDVSDVKEDEGVLGRRRLLQGGVLRRRGPLRDHEDPAETAASLVNLLAESITQKLNDQSVPAMRIPPNQPLSSTAWLVRGQFLEVNEGNRLQRAVIGFGAGATDMQIEVDVFDLGSHPDTPFLSFGSDTGSGKKPGAIITMNPYVAAAKFVLSKNASEKDVRHAGEQIASEILKYMKARGLLSAK